MVDEVLEFLRCRSLADEASHLFKPDAVFIDGTLGTGGHTLALLEAHPTCRVLAFDRDADSQELALRRLAEHGVAGRVTPVLGDFRHAPRLLEPFFDNSKVGADGRPIKRIDGALVDAGMSLLQVSWPERGLSFRNDGPLDMRYDRTSGPSAADLVNRLSPHELEDLFFKFADERWARRIAAFIAEHRSQQPITTTSELVQIVQNAIPAGVRHQSKVHPATKTFAALRLAVNDEFWALDDGSEALCSVLAPTARLVVLTYSSNEDRTIKRTFRRLAGRAQGNETRDFARSRPRRRDAFSLRHHDAGAARSSLTSLFPIEENSTRSPLRLPFEVRAGEAAHPDSHQPHSDPDFAGARARSSAAQQRPSPGVGGRDWKVQIITPKPVTPTPAEIERNPLARSCTLRAVERLPDPQDP